MEAFCIFMYFFWGETLLLLDPTPPQGRGVEHPACHERIRHCKKRPIYQRKKKKRGTPDIGIPLLIGV